MEQTAVESTDGESLVKRLQSGDEAAFADLVRQLHPSMVRVASGYVDSHAVAEDVAQETWLAVVKGIHRFEERSSLRTWIFSILLNQARAHGGRERRTVPVSTLPQPEAGPVLDDSYFSHTNFLWGWEWAQPPQPWILDPADVMLAGELRAVIARTAATLPERQRLVFTLRDVEGWPADDVCSLLGLTQINQRSLLHRARAKIRTRLDDYLRNGGRDD